MSIYQRGNNWYIDFRFKGKRVRECIGPSRKGAEKVIAKKKAEIAENKYLDISQLFLYSLLNFEIGSVRKHCKNDSKQLMGRGKQSFLRRESLSLSSEKISFEKRVLTCHSRSHEIDSSSEMPIAPLGEFTHPNIVS